MQSLPQEILQLIPEHLDKRSLWAFARSCSTFYALYRPLLFKTVHLLLEHSDADELDSYQLEQHTNILASSYKQQVTGSLVHTLAVIFTNGNGRYRVDPLHAGVLQALAALLQTTTQLRKLVHVDVPGFTVARRASQRSTDIMRYRQCLLDLRCLQELVFRSAEETDSSLWLEILLPALPPSLRILRLAVDFHENANLQWLTERLETKRTLAAVTEVSFMCWQMGQACDQILASLMRSTPSLITISIDEMYLSDAVTTELFGASRTHENLYLNAADIPQLDVCRFGLQQQLALRVIAVEAGSDFLYYLAHLPAGIVTLALVISISSASSQDTEVSASLEQACSAMKTCLDDPAWCPDLTQLQVILRATTEDEDEYEEQSKVAENMRVALWKLLHKRKITPKTNKAFWILVPCGDDSE